MSYRYVVLSYVPSIVADTGPEIAVIGLSQQQDPKEEIIVACAEDGWQNTVEADDVEYVSAVLADLQISDAEDRVAMFNALCEMSVGPLRTKTCGECSKAEFALLAQSMKIAKAS